MAISYPSICSLYAFIREGIQKTTTFQVIYRPYSTEFDDIYDKEITKRYEKYELKRLSKRKEIGKRKIGVGRPFKLDIKNRFVMLLTCYCLYITYTLVGVLFKIDQSNVCTETYKKLRDWYKNMHHFHKRHTK